MARTYNGRFYTPDKPKSGTGWLIGGLCLIPAWPSFFGLIASIWCFVKYGKVQSERKLYNRFHEYCTVIGMRERVPIRELKTVGGGGIADVRKGLQQMIFRGYFGPDAYIDLSRNELVLTKAAAAFQETRRGSGRLPSWRDVLMEVMSALQGEQIFQGDVQEGEFSYQPEEPEEKAPEQQTEPQPESPKSAKKTYAEELERTLNELYQLNVQIEDEGVSQRIDRIGTLTAGIFRVVIEKPEREQDVRKFMNYYLPTTIKLLRSYDMLEDQSYQSQNIKESRKKIEDVLDMLIAAFEKQLDRLFKNDALDIATDIDVLETMMAGDGLSSKGQMPL